MNCLYAQNQAYDIQMQAINNVVEGYNHKNYKAMKKPWFWLGKVIITKKHMKKEFEPFYNNYGKAKIDTVTYSSKYEFIAKLIMEKEPEARIFLRFIFSDKGKIEGMGFDYPSLIYRKVSSHKVLNNEDFKSKIDTLINHKFINKKTNSFNGSVLVTDNGKSVYKKHFGYSDFNLQSKLNDSTLYELASCSKQFTAMAILILAQQNKLNLTDTIQKFIPNFPYTNITIKNLLTHTSGLPDYETLLKKVWDKTKFATNNDVVEQFIKHKPKVLFQPNEAFTYCNSGYVILSLIIEKASGLGFNEFLHSAIFDPLKMNHTRVYNTRRVKGEIIDNYAYGYVYSNELKKYVLPDSTKQYSMVVYQDAITGDGCVNSSIDDLIKWENELLNPGLVKKDFLELAFANHLLRNGKPIHYGYGFFLSGGGNSERLIYHTGGWPGYTCIMMRFPDLQKAIIILTNNSFDNISILADDIASRLVEN